MAMGDGGGRKSDIISLHEMKEAQHGERGGKGKGSVKRNNGTIWLDSCNGLRGKKIVLGLPSIKHDQPFATVAKVVVFLSL